MSEQQPQTVDRNDPSIDPDGTLDSTEATPEPAAQPEPAPQVSPKDTNEQGSSSEENIYTPDFDPEEKSDTPRSNPHPVQGEDADIDTDGG